MKTIEVRAARTQQAVLDRQCDDVTPFDTVSEAKRYAKNCLTDNHQQSIEAIEPLRYSQVVVDGRCEYDYFRKGYNGQD